MKRPAGRPEKMAVKKPAAKRPAAVATTARGGRVNEEYQNEELSRQEFLHKLKQYAAESVSGQRVEIAVSCREGKNNNSNKYTYRFYCRSCTVCTAAVVGEAERVMMVAPALWLCGPNLCRVMVTLMCSASARTLLWWAQKRNSL